jgi:hypothetical protein
MQGADAARVTPGGFCVSVVAFLAVVNVDHKRIKSDKHKNDQSEQAD